MQDIILFAQQHWLLALAVLVILIALAILEFIRLQRQTWQINPGQLTQLINHENAIVIDIRTADTYQKGHIVDAISLPMQDLQDPTKKMEKHRTKPIAIVCEAGISSQKVAALLKKAGYNACSLKGGMRAWKDADMPVVR
ncbi:MAG: hypothetical protein A3J38_04180 [Gammaproteobacteria bacterium RIFCSPHIGHO2_12_FULL_45_9]|nr:MAG: hypothetical protein A3J38_04180 [Gammaproteobacteria bacterium RIFCSPHIGHO2_12_FULL_45_9]